MAKYYVIQNKDGRFLKFRTGSNGKKHAWVKNLLSASHGTENNMKAGIEQMKHSPFYPDLRLYYLGESEIGWKALFRAWKKLEEDQT